MKSILVHYDFWFGNCAFSRCVYEAAKKAKGSSKYSTDTWYETQLSEIYICFMKSSPCISVSCKMNATPFPKKLVQCKKLNISRMWEFETPYLIGKHHKDNISNVSKFDASDCCKWGQLFSHFYWFTIWGSPLLQLLLNYV